jgi:hypothetical protein
MAMTRGSFLSLLMMAKAAIAPVAAAAASLPANRGSMGTHCISSLLAPHALEAILKAGANDAVQARSAPSDASHVADGTNTRK